MATPQLLPAGPLATAGNQIVDTSGNPVRIAAVNWIGAHLRNGVPEGLSQASYTSILDTAKAIGFNTIRIALCDAAVIAGDFPVAGTVSSTLNPSMGGLSCLGVLDLILTYCNTIGLRVILASFNSEGRNTVNAGMANPNGLWYDSGGGSNNTDQGGNSGTVTDASFVSMWQVLANRYKTFPALLGYDLRNEPAVAAVAQPGGCVWGGDGNRDLRSMYQRVGAAIQAIDPNPLVICQAPLNPYGTFATGTAADGTAYGTGTSILASSGDLTGVRNLPVALSINAKLVYSVHEFPPEGSGNAFDRGGQTKINQMSACWGFVAKTNTAPVFVGEMGSYFNGTATQVSGSTTWANMMVGYCNGTAAGAPTFSGAQQGLSTGWWVLAVDETPGLVPDYGVLTAWQSGVARSAQSAFFNQLLFYGGAAAGVPANPTVSPNGTVVTAPSLSTITDVNGHVWGISSGAQVTVDGVVDTTTSSIEALAYISGLIWQEAGPFSGINLWWSKSTPTDTWLPVNGTTTSPIGAAPQPSPSGTTITQVGSAIVDLNGNLWGLNSSSQVVVNGVADITTANVVALVFVANQIWYETAGLLWQMKIVPTDVWSPVGGTAANPLAPAVARIVAPLVGTVTTGTWVAHDIAVSGVTLPSGKPVHFATLLPSGYTTAASYPVLVWLHPSFQTTWYNGGSVETPLALTQIDANGWYNTLNFRRNYPCIVVVAYADQSSGNALTDNWGGGANTGPVGSGTVASGDTGPNVFALAGVVAWVLANMSGDSTRVILQGYDMGATGVQYAMLRANQLNGTPPLYTAGLAVAGAAEIHGAGVGPTGADAIALTNVPLWCISGATDTTTRPADWNDPLWRQQSGNSVYPAPGGTAAQAQAGTTQFRYWRDPAIGHQQTDSGGNPYPINATVLNSLFAQIGPIGAVGTTVVQPTGTPTLVPLCFASVGFDPSASPTQFNAEWDAVVALFGGRSPTFYATFFDQNFPADPAVATLNSYGWPQQAAYSANAMAGNSRTRVCTPIVAWTMGTTGAHGGGGNFFAAIIAGTYNTFIDQALDAYKAAGFTTLHIRPGWEMNLGFPWTMVGNVVNYVAAFRALVTEIRRYAALISMTVFIIWCPNVATLNGPTLAQAYPGDAYVDGLGIDEYGTGVDDGWRNNAPGTATPNTGTYLLQTMIDMATGANGQTLGVGKFISVGESGANDAAFINAMVTALTNRPAAAQMAHFGWWENSEGIVSIVGQTALSTAWAAGIGANGSIKNGPTTTIVGPTAPVQTVWNIVNGIAAWTPNTPVARGQRVSNNGLAYQCAIAGTTAGSIGPTGTIGNILDGTARWRYLANIDFADRSGAVAALPAAFTANLTLQFANISSQTTTAAVPFVRLTGHVTGAFGLTLTALPADSIRTYISAQSNLLAVNPSAGVTFLQPLATATAANYTIINDPTVTIDGLQFQDPASGSTSSILQATSGNSALIVRNCIFDGYSQVGAPLLKLASSGTILVTNCLLIDRQPPGGSVPTVQAAAGPTSIRFVNCTFIALNVASGTGPLQSALAGTIARNCAFFGYGATGNANVTFDHCATDAVNFGSGSDGGSNLFARLASDQFVNPFGDWRVLGTSVLVDGGVTDLTDIPAGDDIGGVPRKQGPAWDIGCWERISFTPAEFRPPPIRFW